MRPIRSRHNNIAGSPRTKKRVKTLMFQVVDRVADRRKAREDERRTNRQDLFCAGRGGILVGEQAAAMTVVLLLGLSVGVLVGLLGIGGGVVLVPAMVYLLGMDQHMAQGTSLFILLPPIGLGALREYWRRGQVD